MEEEHLYRSIYEYLLARIYFGPFSKEKHLPSIHKLGNLFGVSTITVRSAYRLLEQDGHIATQKNKRTKIVSDPFSERSIPSSPFPGNILLNRKIRQDIYLSSALIFPRLFYCGLRTCSEEELLELDQILSPPSHPWNGPAMRFMAHMLHGLKNTLALDLYYDVMLFTSPTYLAILSREPGGWKQVYADLHPLFTNLLRLNRSGDHETLWQQFQKSCAFFSPRSDPAAQDFLRNSAYHWRKPRVCLSTATRLIGQIILGTYPAGAFLPSARLLAEETSTAVITVRRAIALLNDLGLAESINGRGTRILSPEQTLEKIHWDKPAVRRNLITYLEALHLLTITCRNVAETVFPSLSPKDKAKAVESMYLAQKRGTSGMFIYIYLDLLTSSMKLPALQEIYTQLINLLILGQPLSCLKPQFCLDHCAHQLRACLESPDPELFAAVLEQLLIFTFLSSREKMEGVGIHEAGRLRLTL